MLNLTQGVSQRLDDAAAGVLFGDSEENMLKLSGASSNVLHSLSRVATELERLGKPCPLSSRVSHERDRRPARAAAVEEITAGESGGLG